MPFFSIVIPLYNKDQFILKTLQGVWQQTFTDFEVVVVDDGSTDKSSEIVKSVSDSRLKYIRQENQGVSAARNLGIWNATACYIAFLDADDYWYPDYLQTMFELIGQFPEQRVFAAAYEIETSKRMIPAQYSIPPNNDVNVVDFFDASRKETVIWTSASVFHKSVFEDAGQFDLDIKSGQDTDLWIRIGLKFQVVFCRRILARYVYDPESLSKNLRLTPSKLNFSKFESLEKTHSGLKHFLDLNRFSLAVKSAISHDHAHFQMFRDGIDSRNLSVKKKLILACPAFMLRMLVKLKYLFANAGLGNSVFK